MRILFKITTRSRPEKYAALVANITQMATLPYMLVTTADYDDMTMKGMQNVIYGHSKSKVDAINRDIPQNGWDILVNVSDDQLFIKMGFDEDIREAFGQNLDQFIHFPDGYTDNRLCSLSIMGKDYYDRFGYIYHPDYVSLWSDNEAKDVAEQLGRYKYVDKAIFVHNHPAWVGGKVDAQLEATQKYYRQDERTYIKRKAAGFPNTSVL